MEFSADNTKLLLYNLTVAKVWDIQNGTLVSEFRLPLDSPHLILSADLSPDGKKIAIGGLGEGNISIIDADTGTLERELFLEFSNPKREPFKQLIDLVSFSFDGKWLFTSAGFHGMYLWDTQTYESRFFTGSATKIELFPSGDKVLWNNGGTIQIGSFPEGKPLTETFHDGSPVIIDNGKKVRFLGLVSAPGDEIYRIRERDAETGELLFEFDIESERSSQEDRINETNPLTLFSPNGRILAFLPRKMMSSIRFSNGRTGNELRQMNSPNDKAISTSTFSPDGTRLAVVAGNEVTIFNVSDLTSSIPFAKYLR